MVFDIDKERFLITCDGISIRAPLQQFRVFCYLWEHPEFVRSRAAIIEHCWPNGISADIYDDSVNSTIKRLRQKLRKAFGPDANPIGAYFGEGYFFREEYRCKT